jgi:hypothetical protein
MSRPTKQGVDYFPVDVQFDDKIEILIADKGAEGLGILITIWQLIYQNEGYYIKDSEDLCLLIRRRSMSVPEKIKELIKSALDRDIFDKDLYKKYKILTSKALQKRYAIASKKKTVVKINKKYWLSGVSVNENTAYIGIDSSDNATNVKEDVDVKVDIEVKGKEDGQTDFISKIFLDCWGIPSIRITTQQRMIMEGWIPLYGEREIQLACNEAVKQGKDHKALAYIEKIMSNKVQKIAIEKSKAEALKKKIEVQESATSKPWTKGILLNELYDDEGRLKKVIK